MNLHVLAKHITSVLLLILCALNGAWQIVYPEVLKQRRKGFLTSSRGVQRWYDTLMRIPQSWKCCGIKNQTLGNWVMEQTVHRLRSQVSLFVLHGKVIKLFWISFSLQKGKYSSYLVGSKLGLSDIICAKYQEWSLINSSYFY